MFLPDTEKHLKGDPVKYYVAAASFSALLVSLAFSSTANAYTCSGHYNACLKYGHGVTKCGCAKRVCQKAVGSADAGAKWNGIPGVNACFKK